MSPANTGRLKEVGLVALVALAAFLAYQPALHGGWLWDDGLEVAGNPMVHSASGWWRGWTAPEGMDYFPLKGTLQWIEWHLWGDQTVGYHAINLLLHLGVALLTWRLLTRLGVAWGWAGALLIAVHPLAVESVAWIAEMKTELSLALALAAVDRYLSFEDSGKRGAYAASLGLFALALLSKSTVVMIPAVLILLALWRRGRLGKADAWRIAPFFLVSLGLGIVTVLFQSQRAIGMAGPMPVVGERVGQAGWSLLLYLKACVVPLGLVPIYRPFAPGGPAWVPWLVAVGLVVAMLAVRRPWSRAVALALVVFGCLLLPVLGLVPMAYLRVAPRADHLAYPGLVPVVALAAAGLALLAASPWGRRAALVLVAGVSVGFLGISRVHAGWYSGGRALWTAAVDAEPEAWVAQANLGEVLLDEGHVAEAAVALDRAEALMPDSAELRLDRGNAHRRLGQRAVAAADYDRAILIDPQFAGAYYDRGVFRLEDGRLSEAASDFAEAIRKQPDYAAAHNNLGLVLANLGRPQEARAEYERTLALEPRNLEALLNLGNLLARQGDGRGAVREYRLALSIDPTDVGARRNLAVVERAYGIADEGGHP